MSKLSKQEAGKIGGEKSRLILRDMMNDRMQSYHLNPKKCKQCSGIMPYHNRYNTFCCKGCAATFNNNNKHWRSRIEKPTALCPSCGIQFNISERRKKYCNIICSNKSRINEISARNGNKIKDKKVCIQCNSEYIGFRNSSFCSQKCNLEIKKEIRIRNVEAGIASSNTSKRYLIEKHGAKCMDCGWDKINPVTNKCPIELEHLDGNSTNNKPENLKLLCPSCHSLTPTYKALNKGNGRHDRLKRYHDGKSY